MNKKLKETLIIEGVKFLFSWLGGLFESKKQTKREIEYYKKEADKYLLNNNIEKYKKYLEVIKKLEKEL